MTAWIAWRAEQNNDKAGEKGGRRGCIKLTWEGRHPWRQVSKRRAGETPALPGSASRWSDAELDAPWPGGGSGAHLRMRAGAGTVGAQILKAVI